MNICSWMIILSLFILPYLGNTKTSYLNFIGCYNVKLESYHMVVTTSVCAPLWCDDICEHTLTVLYHSHIIISYFRCNLLIKPYGIFTSLYRTISYLWIIYGYNLFLSISSLILSTLDLVSSPSVSTLDLIPSLSDQTLTTFQHNPWLSLVPSVGCRSVSTPWLHHKIWGQCCL